MWGRRKCEDIGGSGGRRQSNLPAIVVEPVRHVLNQSGTARDGFRDLVCYVANADNVLRPDVVDISRLRHLSEPLSHSRSSGKLVGAHLPLMHYHVESLCDLIGKWSPYWQRRRQQLGGGGQC
eukprot:753086-Hanusia_phi.AAC.5